MANIVRVTVRAEQESSQEFGCINLKILSCFAEVPLKPVPRPYALCTWSLVPDSPEVLMVEDLTQDAR